MTVMKTMVLGSGGREHAFVMAAQASKFCGEVIFAPGNAGVPVENRRAVDVNKPDAVVALAQSENVDLVIIGPEDPLALGVSDALIAAGIKVVGPRRGGAELEADKGFMHKVCEAANVPTAPFWETTDLVEACGIIDKQGAPIVVKAYGRCQGKGVVVAQTIEEAKAAVEDMLVNLRFGDQGNRIIIEKCLVGVEASAMFICDGENAYALAVSRDYKRAGDNDTGSNTGGMGVVSPADSLPGNLVEVAHSYVVQILHEMARFGIPFKGIMFLGLMIASDGAVTVLEINVRGGDPETQAAIARFDGDIIEYLLTSTEMGALSELPVPEERDRAVVGVVLASGGYPGSYEKGKLITGIEDAEAMGATVLHAGTEEDGDGNIITSGGRVLLVLFEADTVEEARTKAYLAAEKIHFEGKYLRTDIALPTAA